MLSDFRTNLVKNAVLTSEVHDKIIMLKDQYWHYPKESHERWRKENLHDDDYHLWLENEAGELIAYLNLVFLQVRFDKRYEKVIGVGNVCVNKDLSGNGIGLLLMQICNYYITNHERRSVILCNKTLANFYTKSGWIPYPGKVVVKAINYSGLVMFNKLPEELLIEIEKKF